MGDLPYYIMPYLKGESLRDRLSRERQLRVDDALRIVIQVADALNYAHAVGVVHRDIKPGNIILTVGHAVVGDFGIARALSAGRNTTTEAGTALGTAAYMSPEQVAAEPQIDGRSDIYSLGLVLYEMLVGTLPFSSTSTQALMSQRLIQDAPPISASREGISESLDQVVRVALARTPADRYRTAGEFGEALERLQRGERRKPPTSISKQRTPHTLTPSADALRVDRPTVASHRQFGESGESGAAIAVLPLINVSSDPDNEYFADGITDGIIEALVRLRTMRVVARSSVFALKRRASDVREIARQLSVSFVLEGTVRRVGARARIAVQLVDASNGYQVWAKAFDIEENDIFTVQDEVASSVAQELSVVFHGRADTALVPRPTQSADAFDHYLRGRFCLNKRTEQSVREGLRFFEQSIARDPSFALAHAGLAASNLILAVYGAAPPLLALPIAEREARTALAHDPSLAEPHAILGCERAVVRADWHGAEEEFRLALAISPQNPLVLLWYATHCLLPRARFDEATSALEAAWLQDPLAIVVRTSIGLPHYFARRFDEAITGIASHSRWNPISGLRTTSWVRPSSRMVPLTMPSPHCSERRHSRLTASR